MTYAKSRIDFNNFNTFDNVGDVKIKVQVDTTNTKTPPKARRRGRLMTDSSKISFRLDTTRNKPIYRPKVKLNVHLTTPTTKVVGFPATKS